MLTPFTRSPRRNDVAAAKEAPSIRQSGWHRPVVVVRPLETQDSKPPWGDPSGRGTANSRNGSYPKTALTAEGSVEIEVPRDRAATFEPQIAPKCETRLEDGVATVIRPSLEAFTADVR
jgi:hypothetical protein